MDRFGRHFQQKFEINKGGTEHHLDPELIKQLSNQRETTNIFV